MNFWKHRTGQRFRSINYLNYLYDTLADEQDIEDVDPGLVDHQAYSSTSLHSMDDDLHPNLDTDHSKKHTTQENGSETGPALMLKKVIKRCKNCSIIWN